MWPPMFPCGTTQGYAYMARAIVWPCHTASSGLKASLGALLIDLKNPVIYIFKDFTVDLDLCIDLDPYIRRELDIHMHLHQHIDLDRDIAVALALAPARDLYIEI